MSELITLIEEQEYLPRLDDKNPILGTLYCAAEHSPDLPSKIRRLLRKRSKHGLPANKKKDRLAENAAELSAGVRFTMQTSQAVDLISGGAKVNALPERTSATVNHRINIGERPRDAEKNIEHLARHVAKKYGLSVNAYNGKEEPSSISLYVNGNHTLEPAPVTPTSIYSETHEGVLSPYGVLSGTTRALYGSEIIMAPGLSTGNTDTRWYWDLTRHIFRYGPGYSGETGLGNIHTVDERQSVAAHVNAIKWFGAFIRNMDEVELP